MGFCTDTENVSMTIIHYKLVTIHLCPVSYCCCSMCPGPTWPMSAAISARTAPNAKTSGFCHEQKKEQEQLSASHPSPLMTELEVIKKERSKDRLGCTKSSSLVHFDRTLAGLLFLHTRGEKVCNISSFNQKIINNILAAFFVLVMSKSLSTYTKSTDVSHEGCWC